METDLWIIYVPKESGPCKECGSKKEPCYEIKYAILERVKKPEVLAEATNSKYVPSTIIERIELPESCSANQKVGLRLESRIDVSETCP